MRPAPSPPPARCESPTRHRHPPAPARRPPGARRAAGRAVIATEPVPATERTPASTPELRFHLLGPLTARVGDHHLDLGRSQQQAFLAMLLAHPGRPLTAARLAEGVFDEDNPPSRPRSVLATHAYRLRRALRDHRAEHLLVTVDGGYRLDVPAESLDSVVFDRLVAQAEDPAADRPRARDLLTSALALHEGEPLAGLPGAHAVELRRHLAERRVAALEAKLALDVDLGDNPSCLVELDQAVFAHPFRERFRALLMLEYHLADRPAEALAVYADARRDYRAEGLDCPELDTLHTRIRRADPALGTATRPVGRSAAAHGRPVPDRGADPGGTPVPEQLPTPLADFTGRQSAVAELATVLTRPHPGAVVISAINGIGGSGKTGLAVHVAHALRAWFPDGRLHLDLRGTRADPLDPVEALGLLLASLGVADREIPADPAERAALYRTTVAGRRLLVLLDDAASAEQIAPLLPGARTCAVLVTSRVWLTGLPGAHHLHLDAMRPAEALDLLAIAAGRARTEAEPEAATAIVTACGLLPLAVRVAGSRLAADPAQSLAGLARALADEQTRLAELAYHHAAVEPVLALSYARLDGEQARALRLLALPDTAVLGLGPAAALLDRAPERTRELLETLADLNLLNSPAADRYRLHGLLRVFARRRGAGEETPAEVSAAYARLLAFCLATARNAEATAHRVEHARRSLITAETAAPGRTFDTVEDATAWLRDQTELHRTVIRRACQDPALPLAQAADLTDKMGSILFGRDYVTTVGDLAARVAEAAPARGERDAEALARSVRGSMLWHAGSYAAAGEELRRCLPLCVGAALRRLRANVLQLLGANARALSDFEAAIGPLEGASSLFHQLDDETAEGLALGELGYNHARCGHLTRARAAGERCAELTGGEVSISSSVGSYYLARILHLCGDLARALERAESALARFRSFGMPAFQAATGGLIARIHLTAGRPTAAVRAAEEALPQARCVGGMLEGTVLRTLGQALADLGHRSRAGACLGQAHEHFRRLGLDADAAETERLLGVLIECPSP
ncbi:BTAD domain-containing putative transcriptional regulator [Kitasatospora sp. NBC_00240]|uniref:AfsR/SARP family transcriptional regulator n=1 Tax=Kitasatospora sp. NBC_00240 TaxID=2903567 RepID=UPI002B1D68A5|nr:BTAD domain-containing putative transcriptional regulator [Kitasatospora sp. NBC_00240]